MQFTRSGRERRGKKGGGGGEGEEGGGEGEGKKGEGRGEGRGELFGFQLNISECEQEPKALEELTSLIFQVTTGFR